MPLLQIFVLALIQGLTEFLPVSSSGHLILVPNLTGWQDQGLIIDVAVHLGTLGAVVLYFWKDVWAMIHGLFMGIYGKPTDGTKLAMTLVVATIPVVIVGYLIHEFTGGSGALRSPTFVAAMALVFGAFLYAGDKFGKQSKNIQDVTFGRALLMGLAQSLALMPGVSRSGSIITTARSLGFTRKDAARYAFLMSIPAISGVGILTGYDIYKSHNITLGHDAFLSMGLSFLFSLAGIHFMMQWVQRHSLTPFVIYRFILGIALLVYTYFYL